MTDYQKAQARINSLSPHAMHRPDSLTRRNGTLIARRRFPFTHQKAFISILWTVNIKELFPEARIQKTTVDPKNNARVYFSFTEGNDG